jgi:hypothetical protein
MGCAAKKTPEQQFCHGLSSSIIFEPACWSLKVSRVVTPRCRPKNESETRGERGKGGGGGGGGGVENREKAATGHMACNAQADLNICK